MSREQNDVIWMSERIKENGYNMVWDGYHHRVTLPDKLVKRFALSNIDMRFRTVQEAYSYFLGVQDALWWSKNIARGKV